MRILFNCNTYYQLIVAIQLRLTEFKNDEVILCLSDLSINATNIVDRIVGLGIFTDAHLIKKYDEIREKKNNLKRMSDIAQMVWGAKEYDFGKVDLLMYYNIDEVYIYKLFATLIRKNPNIICRSFEESYFTYFGEQSIPYPSIHLANDIRRILRMDSLTMRTNVFYCFKPEAYGGKLEANQIPPFDENLEIIKKVLGDVFDIQITKDHYRQKYIFFTSVFDFEGGDSVGEFELVCRVAELVGKENIMIKTHPRDKRSVYSDNGYIVDTNSSIPWEAIQINSDFADKVFLTLNSSSVLLATTNMVDSPNVGYLYDCIDLSKNSLAQKSKISADMLFSVMNGKKGFEKIHILSDINEIVDL